MIKQLFTLFFTLIFLCIGSCSHAGKSQIVSAVEDLQATWDVIDISFILSESGANARIKSRVGREGKKLDYLEVELLDMKVKIQPEHLNKVNNPHLNTLKVFYTPINVKNKNWLFTISLDFGEWVNRNMEKEGEFSNIEIGIDRKGLLDVIVYDARLEKSKYVHERR